MIVLLMGVAGSGKTTVGRRLSEELGWPFCDADDFHQSGNVEKMSRGVPLTDADRETWLTTVHKLIKKLHREKQSAVVACSALKQAYRDRLFSTLDDVRLVYLNADHELCRQRLTSRTEHFFHPDLLANQFQVLEEPTGATTLDAAKHAEILVADIRKTLGL